MGNYDSIEPEPITGSFISNTVLKGVQLLTKGQAKFLSDRCYWLMTHYDGEELSSFQVFRLSYLDISDIRKIGTFEGGIYGFSAKDCYPFIIVRNNNRYAEQAIVNLNYYVEERRRINNASLLLKKRLVPSPLLMSVIQDRNLGINWVFEVKCAEPI